jgi:PPIC-type PPIASE domain
MRTSIRTSAPVLAAGALLVACGDSAPPAVTVGPVAYSEDQLLGLSDDRRRMLADLTAFGLAVADSTTEALGAPLVAEWADDRLLGILAADLTLEKNGVADDVLEARYLTDPQWELAVRHILFFSERWRSATHRADAKARAERALESLRAGADFLTTAAELSEEPGAAARQGLLEPGREGSWVPEFWAAALALQPGEISPVTESRYGYHILRLEDRRVVPFHEAHSVIARRVADTIDYPSAVLQAWQEAAASSPPERRAAALAEALRRGLGVPPGEQAELLRAWNDQAYRWSETFRFRYRMDPSALSAAALAALSNPAQGANLARAELSDRSELLAARYPIRIGGSGK